MEKNNEILKGVAALISSLSAGKPFTYREGKAIDEHEPEVITINGVIDTPKKWLEKRATGIDMSKSHIEVNREEMSISLIVNEDSFYKQTITGSLSLSPEFETFGINKGEYLSGLQLSDLIRMNRSFFEDKGKAMDLVSQLRSFKAKVVHDIELSDDKKGNAAQVRRQTVEGNQPPSFSLFIPIFRGQQKRSFEVEIDIDPDTLGGTLVSPDARDIIAEERDKLMDDVIKSIASDNESIPIIEI